jgi:hypothetical protein
MQPQSYASHRRYVPGYHFVLSLVVLSCVVIATTRLITSLLKPEESNVDAIFNFFVSVALVGLFWFARTFALRAQDRAIRAEERLRHYLLTGRPLPSTLRLGQIIALRFASDAEFPKLAQMAADEKISAAEIKKKIQQWKADYNRV